MIDVYLLAKHIESEINNKLEAVKGDIITQIDSENEETKAKLDDIHNKLVGVMEESEKLTGTATQTMSDGILFSSAVSGVIIYAKQYPIYFYPSPDGATFNDGIVCLGGNTTMVNVKVYAFKVARAGDQDADYEVIGLR